MTDVQHPKVGVGIMILKEGKALLGKRKGSHGAGEFAFPGGTLEYMESLEGCAQREIAEECGVEIENLRFQIAANVKAYGKHYLLIGFVADWKFGDAQTLEPEKCEGWDWYPLASLPEPLFIGSHLLAEAYAEKRNYLDA